MRAAAAPASEPPHPRTMRNDDQDDDRDEDRQGDDPAAAQLTAALLPPRRAVLRRARTGGRTRSLTSAAAGGRYANSVSLCAEGRPVSVRSGTTYSGGGECGADSGGACSPVCSHAASAENTCVTDSSRGSGRCRLRPAARLRSPVRARAAARARPERAEAAECLSAACRPSPSPRGLPPRVVQPYSSSVPEGTHRARGASVVSPRRLSPRAAARRPGSARRAGPAASR